jgi:hypothetical protein
MKSGSFAFVLVVLAGKLCCAQGSYQVHLTSGEVLHADRVALVPLRSLGRAHARLNDDPWRDRILIDSVDYIDGIDELKQPVYYMPLRVQGSLVWTTRLFHSDRISIHYARITTATFKHRSFNYYYYTKDGGRPQRLTMQNVKRDVADDPNSALLLKKAKLSKAISTTLSGVGGAILVGSFLILTSAEPGSSIAADDRAPGAFVGGVTFLCLPVFLRSTWRRNLVEGLKIYGNRTVK